MIKGKQISAWGTEDLKQLLLDGRRAAQYASDHYEELAAREAMYTLYGPYDYGIGAARPGRLVSKSSRILALKTRKKQHMIYELDSEYKLLRVKHVFNAVNDLTYHCFSLEGIQYACPFAYNQKSKQLDEVIALDYKDGTPCFCGYLTETKVLAFFYEYISAETVHVTEYSYNPVSKYSLHGHPIDPNAPLGALNSPAQRGCCEEEPMYTDFALWITDPKRARQQLKKKKSRKITDWIDEILNLDIPDNVVAFCFNLYEEGGGEWSMELVGSGRFDSEDEDWPCDEVTDFQTRKNPYKWEKEYSWEDALAYAVKELQDYLANGKYADLLKSRMGVGVGFVDGDIEVLYSK